ncbi:hypothetical protein R1sor_012930 [Riccia sorocarpa]|uniref:Actin n=1 Tax=Riccia sorocarpa TaxID=122646 RepID=A0ABD3IBC1_9MARC
MARGAAGLGKSTGVVLDNGAGFCKAGIGGEADPPLVMPNCMARPRSAINIHSTPLLAAWKGGSLLAASQEFQMAAVTKKEYEECGSMRCRRAYAYAVTWFSKGY